MTRGTQTDRRNLVEHLEGSERAKIRLKAILETSPDSGRFPTSARSWDPGVDVSSRAL